MSNGKDGMTVICLGDRDEEGVPLERSVNRIFCLLETKAQCPTCPKSQFKARFQLRVVDQIVACPKWETEADRLLRRDPLGYVMTSRSVCLSEKPFTHCPDCHNGSPRAAPRTQIGWVEEEERQRRIELELDEEERLNER